MALEKPSLSCRRAALIEQMVLHLARRTAPFDAELNLMVKAYEAQDAGQDGAKLAMESIVQVARVDTDGKIDQQEAEFLKRFWAKYLSVDDLPPVPPEPSWIKRLFSRGN